MSNTLVTDDAYQLCIQITDSHLFANPQERLLDVPTSQTLEQVIKLINHQHSHVDLVIATGDISQDESLGAYQNFQNQIKQINAPSIWLPGNHDNFSVIEQLDNFKTHLITQYDIGNNWRVFILNTQVIGENFGKLSQHQQDALFDSLQTSTRFHLICMHHPVFATDTLWLNDIKLQESWLLLDQLEYYLNARVILCGHVHQNIELCYKGVYLFSTPSTCVQFAPNCENFKLDNVAPGYRWLKLFDDGNIDTGVVRLEENLFPGNHTAENY